MVRLMSSIVGGVCCAVLATVSLSVADVPSTSSAMPEPGLVPGNIPATGDEDMAKLAAETLRGKLIKAEDRIYTVETGPNTQTQVRVDKDTKFEDNYQGMAGDWIEGIVTPEMHMKSVKKSTPAYTVEGGVLKVDGDFFVVKDTAGKEIRLQMDNKTNMTGTHKVGDWVKAVYTPDGHVLAVKPAHPTRGESGG
jgi:hypothetical protein